MKQLLGIFLGISIVVGIAILINLGTIKNSLFKTSAVSKPYVTIDNQTFSVEVAKTLAEEEEGLADRTNMPSNKGMLFPFNKADYYGFWMKGMKFPLDIIYIRDNKIVTIFTNLPTPTGSQIPPIVKPVLPADTVFEINAGLAQKYNFKNGDSVTIAL